jgi:hypothetical protein
MNPTKGRISLLQRKVDEGTAQSNQALLASLDLPEILCLLKSFLTQLPSPVLQRHYAKDLISHSSK